jgi:hypothetical protein
VVRITWVWFPQDVLDKLWDKHELEQWEVEEAIFDDPTAVPVWDDHPVHGRRVILHGKTASGRSLFISLKPLDEVRGWWRCRTAYEEGDEDD